MDENARTLYCGNLSEKITEDILYELFLQGGPVQKISIPKDRDGKQRPFAFVTYKHIHSVEYALRLFDGTELYNRTLNMKLRNNVESQQVEQSSNPVRNINHMLELGQQMLLGNYPPQNGGPMFFEHISQNVPTYPRQLDVNCGNDDRTRRNHPYVRNRDRKQERNRDRNRERDRERDKDRAKSRERNDHYRDERSYHNRDNWNSHRFNGYSRYNDNRKKWTN
ncbi:splicing regulator RBM11 [Anoplolepis gracilipes]|uniref:splicing regulator RBM11 n=1 Tax=Anoplolepis gracilipes TaxID=354296 RepID=UPI003BA0BD70